MKDTTNIVAAKDSEQGMNDHRLPHQLNMAAKRMTLWLLTGFKFLWIGLLFVLALPVLVPTYLICDMPDDIERLIDRLKESLDNDDTRNGG